MLAPKYHSASIKPSVILDPQVKKSGLLHTTPTPYEELASGWEVSRSALFRLQKVKDSGIKLCEKSTGRSYSEI